MQVKRAMHKGVRRVDPDTPIVERARAALREHDTGAIPIGENDRLLGMVTDKDMVCRCVALSLDPLTHARAVMTAGIQFCLQKDELGEAARPMESTAGDQCQQLHDRDFESRSSLTSRRHGP